IGGNAGEAIAAMVSLGYTNSEAAAVIGKLDQSLPVDEMIKAALKAIAMKR
ncbi:MAG: Holliday junction branch migration protein RuvA, partial [Oscillospiraceae bacterium]|nr:Holliday junction branch migration protein RuvA [Oscillospiraceae bacterium]